MGIGPLPKIIRLKNAILGPCEEVACSVQDTSLDLFQMLLFTPENLLHFLVLKITIVPVTERLKSNYFPYMGNFASCVVSGQPLRKLQLGNFTLPFFSVQSEALEITRETHSSPLIQVSQQQNLGSSTSHWGFY